MTAGTKKMVLGILDTTSYVQQQYNKSFAAMAASLCQREYEKLQHCIFGYFVVQRLPKNCNQPWRHVLYVSRTYRVENVVIVTINTATFCITVVFHWEPLIEELMSMSAQSDTYSLHVQLEALLSSI